MKITNRIRNKTILRNKTCVDEVAPMKILLHTGKSKYD